MKFFETFLHNNISISRFELKITRRAPGYVIKQFSSSSNEQKTSDGRIMPVGRLNALLFTVSSSTEQLVLDVPQPFRHIDVIVMRIGKSAHLIPHSLKLLSTMPAHIIKRW